MNIYSPNLISRSSLLKRAEHFFQKAFLICSIALTLIIILFVIDKSSTVGRILESKYGIYFGNILLYFLVLSFSGWVAFLVINGSLGRTLKQILTGTYHKTKMAGSIVLFIWLMSTIFTVISFIFDKYIRLGLSADLYSQYTKYLLVFFLLDIFLLPVWIFTNFFEEVANRSPKI